MPAAFSEENIKRLPVPIVEKLEDIIARIRRVLWLRGLWLTCAAMLGSLLAVMAIDALFDIESVALRCALSSAGALVAAVVAWRFLVRPLTRRVSLAAVARWIDVHHPEMQERISTAVELLSSRDPASLRGSEELLGEVVKSAVGDAATVSPEAEFSGLPARTPKRLAMATLCLLMAVLAVWPFHSSILLMRALIPFADFGNAASFELRVLSEDVQMAEGEPVTLLVAARGRGHRRVELRQKSAAGTTTVERMLPEVSSQVQKNEKAFALHIPAAKESFRYHVTSGAARTREYQVTVWRRPEVTGLAVTLTYPTYTRLPPKTDPDSSGDIVALPGTTADFSARLKIPASSARLDYDQTENAGPPVSLESDAGVPLAKWAITVERDTNLRWRLSLRGEGEVEGRSREGVVRAVEDLPPAVVIDSPIDRQLTLRPNEVLPIIYTAADDFGFSAVDLRVELEGRGETLQSCALPEKDAALAQTWHGKASLDLSRLSLEGVNSLRVQVRAADNLPASLHGPQLAVSDEILIRLNWGAQSFPEQTVAKQEQQLRRELDKIRSDLRDERSKAEQKMQQFRNREEMKPEHLEQLEKLTQKTAQTAAELQQLAEKMQHSAFAERADALENAAQLMVKPAAQSLQEIPQRDKALERAEAAREARDQLSEAIKVAEKTIESFPQDQQQAAQAAQLVSLAQQEQKLADSARDGSVAPPPAAPPANTSQSAPTAEQEARRQREALERWQQQQQQVASQTENLSRQLQGENPQGQQEQLQTLAQQARALATDAEQLTQKQDGVESQTRQTSQTGQPPPSAAAPSEALQAEADVASDAEQLTEAIAEFQRNAGPVLSQNGEALEGVMDATRQLHEASESGREAVRELAQAASRALEAGSSTEPAAGAQRAESPPAAAKVDNSSQPAQTPDSPVAEVGANDRPGDEPAPADSAASASSAALDRTSDKLDGAAEALQSTVAALLHQATGIGTEVRALGEASQQTQRAAQAGQQAQQTGREAGQQASQQSKNAGQSPQVAAQQADNAANAQALAEHAAEPAQQAADSLALAAANAQHALGIPQEGLDSQNMGQHGRPTPGQSNQQAQNAPPNQPGNPGDQQALQTTKAYDLPPELAKLGLTRDDWARIRGLVQSGSEGGTGDNVPAEYRTLVKDYFRALSVPRERKP